ncbi:hypothetical protein CORC01_01296 [Colletotrichum orchidophilum]|uniref:Uncharacterized protein n=1 Tax=Colletotrichum orchidophilum TaxID=1209926 RepID=A0A1G4BQL4_9PEZI|nr:uncharacterized protein CORC01_01296 [Colletotrichum orchidophilum]OHF03577.1 hypothetical protein CORC01_01296 [Colletotrichum orchidophilum]
MRFKLARVHPWCPRIRYAQHKQPAQAFLCRKSWPQKQVRMSFADIRTRPTHTPNPPSIDDMNHARAHIRPVFPRGTLRRSRTIRGQTRIGLHEHPPTTQAPNNAVAAYRGPNFGTSSLGNFPPLQTVAATIDGFTAASPESSTPHRWPLAAGFWGVELMLSDEALGALSISFSARREQPSAGVLLACWASRVLARRF